VQPTSVLGDVRGFARDFALDALPKGMVWDLVDYIPRRRGARLDGRGAWKYLSPSSLSGQVWGGYHASYKAGKSLLVAAGPDIYEVNPTTGNAVSWGALFPSLRQNGVMLRDRVYFASGAGNETPKVVTRSGDTFPVASLAGTNAPHASLLGVFKDRLLAAGSVSQPQRLYFSELETEGGPPGAWDALGYIDTSLGISAIWPMGAQILIFHDGSIEKIKGTIPPSTDIDTDMYLDPFTDQVGCQDPASVVGWQENVIWAAPRGVYLSDGSTIRSLTEQGGIADLWRTLYLNKRPGTYVTSAIFLDLLFVSVLIDWDGSTPNDLRPFTLVCNLGERSWTRFANHGMTAAIPSSADGEEVWWGVDGHGHAAGYQNRLATLSSMLFVDRDLTAMRSGNEVAAYAAPVDQVDGNAMPVLPQVETGWLRLGQEGVKRVRHVYVSHTTENVAATPATNHLRVSCRLDPYPYAPYVPVGEIPGSDDYERYRLRLGKRSYGITVKVEQITPSYVSRLHDIAVDQWAQDRGKL